MLIERLQELIGYRFKNKDLLRQALSHRSYAHERRVKDNERLEFLGDAVLELIIRNWLYTRYPKSREGELTRLKASLVEEPSLAKVARSVLLNRCLFLGKSELLTGGREKDSILADGLEALVGAIYLDSDFETTKRVVLKIFSCFLESLSPDKISDYKTTLQNTLQSSRQILPKYRIIKTIGPDHDKQFEVGVYIQGRLWAIGKGKSRKAAEQMAAKIALKRLGDTFHLDSKPVEKDNRQP